jgi:Domain of unknown function DUF11
MRKQFLIWLVLLSSLVFSSFANAATLNFKVSTTFAPPTATPLIKVTVSGVEVFNQRSAGFSIPINTTGHVKIDIVELEQFQVLDAWSGVCAGITQGGCEFDAGQDVAYSAGIQVRNLFGTVRFTSSSIDEVRAPAEVGLTILSGVGDVGSTFTRNVIQPCCNTVQLLIGQYVLKAEPTASSGNCFQSSTAKTFNVVVQEAQETLLNLQYKADRCALAVNLLEPFHGSVKSTPSGIDCPSGPIAPDSASPCAAFFAFKSKVKLEAIPDTGFVFAGWASGCVTLEPTCEVSAVPQGAKTAVFTPAVPTFAIADLGIVTSSFLAEDAGGGRVKISFSVKNNGSDAASGVRMEIFPTVFGLFSEIPVILSDGGACNSSSDCLWFVGELVAGQSKTVSFTAATTKTEFALKACTLSTTQDPDQSNNCASGTASLGGTPPPLGNVTAALGSSNPIAKTVLKGSSNVAALQVLVTPPVGSSVTDFALAGLTLQVSGTGNDASDITAVKLFPDNNGNGLVDAGEDALQISSGAFTANDGTLNLSFAPTGILAGRNYLVALDFSSSLAMNQFGISLGGVFLLAGIGFSRRRRFALGFLGLGLTVMLVSCPGDTPAPEIRTYKLSLIAINVQKAGSSSIVSGVPLSGAILSVEK